MRAKTSAQALNEITRLLKAVEEGDTETGGQLLTATYDALRRIAAWKMANEREGHTLQPTALVHEAWLRLERDADQRFSDRGHFLQAAASAMRRILIDHARRRNAGKRGGEQKQVTLDGEASIDRPEDILMVDEALTRLAEVDVRKARLVELRFFGGLDLDEIAGLLDVSTRTLKRDWSYARAWLFREITSGVDRP